MNRKELLSKVAAKLSELSELEDLKCPKHPWYKGKGEPPVGCKECLKTYISYKRIHPRVPHKPTKVIVPNKYKRERYKKDWSDED